MKVSFSVLILLIIVMITFITGVTKYGGIIVETMNSTSMDAESTSLNSTTTSSLNRKLLLAHEVAVQPNRIWADKCSISDIVITQGPTDPLPSGIPTYTVEIMNICTTGCDISSIHLSCGWFSSARLINPRLFKRLHFNDCLVNEGKPLVNGHTVSFQYANTFAYPLTVSSVVC